MIPLKAIPRLLLVLVILVAVWLVLVYFSGYEIGDRESELVKENNFKTYSSEKFGLEFDYPENYFLEEHDLSTPQRERHALVLTEDTEENRLVREGKSPGREGPPAITIDIFQNNLDNYTTESWVRGVNDSNFKLSPDGVLNSTTLDGEIALTYRVSGLYEMNVAALARPDYVYMFSVGWLTPEDRLVSDFQSILDSVKFE